MKIRDKNLKVAVDVFDKQCPTRNCYWARQNPGVFTPGRGYSNAGKDWICGTRAIHGCPVSVDSDV